MASRYLLVSLLPLAAGCDLLSGIDDFVFHDSVAQAGGSGGQPIPCVDPVLPMQVTQDTRLCAGTFAFAAEPGAAAIEIAADNVTLICNGTVLEGPGGGAVDDMSPPTVGIRVAAHQGVTVRGCGARGYRYGLVVVGAGDVTLEELTLDDNFTDPTAPWLSDVRGGGVLLDGVTGGRVERSRFARNWNGIELRSTRGVTVADNLADHCSNSGALLMDAHDNVILRNDMQWAVRGAVAYPAPWYGLDTKDSAGIVIDGGSSQNRIEENDVSYGGDGVFVRGVYGVCPERNTIVGNTLSFSPHNGIECTCDNNVLDGNVSVASNYGIWSGGSDGVVITNNRIQDSKVDGISIQAVAARHVLIEGNEVTGSGRVGILFSGREYQQWHTLANWSEGLVNASHLIVQRNHFTGNAKWDLFSTSARSLVALSNCTPTQTTFDLGAEAEVTRVGGTCQLSPSATPPSAELDAPETSPLGASLMVDASASRGRGPLTFTWLVQASGARFVTGTMPPLIFGGSGGAALQIAMSQPGAYDVDVTVDDGLLASGAYRQVLVPPEGVRVGETAAEWEHTCDRMPPCTAALSDEMGGADGSYVRVVENAKYDFGLATPRSHDLALDASGLTSLGFLLRAHNDNNPGWQGNNPIVVLASAAGTIRFVPTIPELMPVEDNEWLFIEVPLAGSALWSRVDQGASLSQVDWIEIHTDTYGDGVTIDLDALTFY